MLLLPNKTLTCFFPFFFLYTLSKFLLMSNNWPLAIIQLSLIWPNEFKVQIPNLVVLGGRGGVFREAHYDVIFFIK